MGPHVNGHRLIGMGLNSWDARYVVSSEAYFTLHLLAIVPIALTNFSWYIASGQNPVTQVKHAGWSVTGELSADTFYMGLPAALLDGLMPQWKQAGWNIMVNCQLMPSSCVCLWPSLTGRSPTMMSAHAVPMCHRPRSAGTYFTPKVHVHFSILYM